MSPVDTEYYDMVLYTITSSNPTYRPTVSLTWFTTNPQLGVPVDCEEADLKKAYRRAAMKVFNSMYLNLNRLTGGVAFLPLCISIIRTRIRRPKQRKSSRMLGTSRAASNG